MRFGSSRSLIYDAQMSARARFDVACEVWGDLTRHHFDDTVWQPLDALTSEALRGIDQLTVVLTQARHECEYTPGF